MRLNRRNGCIQAAIRRALKTGIPVAGIFLSAFCQADLAPVPRPGLPPVPAVTPGEHFHTVKRGETLSAIALRYGVSQRSILKANGLPPSRADRLHVGQRLRIPQRRRPLSRPEPTPPGNGARPTPPGRRCK